MPDSTLPEFSSSWGSPDLEGRYFWSQGQNISNEDVWYLVSTTDRRSIYGRVGRGSAYRSEYRVWTGTSTFARSRHETWSAAAHMLAALALGRSTEERMCSTCCESRVDSMDAYRYSRRVTVCTTCAHDRYRQCAMCERLASPLHATRSDGSVCARHVGEMLSCTMCSTLHRADEEQCCVHRERCSHCERYDSDLSEVTLYNNDERNLCDRCLSGYQDCSECDLLVHRSDVYRVIGHGNICPNCFQGENNSYRQCRCGSFYDPDADEFNECCDDGGMELIRSYSYKPEPIFHGEGKTFLGMEIEIKTPSVGKMAKLASRGFGKTAILKHDGSVSGGFEIVTHPMSYEWAMDSFSWETLTNLAKEGSYADDDCGIHVHVSKEGFSGPSHDHRWYLFIHRNAEEVQKIARRSNSTWAAFTDDDRRKAKLIAQKKGQNYRRYAAINSIPAHTYEMRVFASSLDIVQIQAALGLVSATVEYTRQLTSRKIIRDNGWAWSTFATWVIGQEKYAPLVSEMTRLHVSV